MSPIEIRKIGPDGNLTRTPMGDHFDISIGDGFEELTISIRDDEVTIRALHGPISVHPRAANTIVVKAEGPQ